MKGFASGKTQNIASKLARYLDFGIGMKAHINFSFGGVMKFSTYWL